MKPSLRNILGPIKAKRNKFGARRGITEDGFKFDSKAEWLRYGQLKKLRRAGDIRDLEVHPSRILECDGKPLLIRSDGYPNGRKAKYTPDFRYVDAKTGQTIVEDVKGGKATITADYRLRRAIYESNTGLQVREVTISHP